MSTGTRQRRRLPRVTDNRAGRAVQVAPQVVMTLFGEALLRRFTRPAVAPADEGDAPAGAAGAGPGG